MALSVFPERMDKIDPQDVDTSLRTIETYIHYMTERTEFALTNTFRTTTGLGSSAEAVSLVLQDTVDKLSAAESEITLLKRDVANRVVIEEGKGLSTNDYTNADKEDVASIDDLAEKVAELEGALAGAGPIIVSGPEDAEAADGTEAEFSVRALGSELAYQWQISQDGDWSDRAEWTAETVTVEAVPELDGAMVRCIVTDHQDRQAVSKAATMTVIS